MFGEPGELDEAAQRQLAPATTHFGATKRRHEVARLTLQLCLSAGEALELGVQCAEGIAPLALERLYLGLGALERSAERFHELRDRDLALLERSLGDHLVAAERFTGESQEELAVGAQRLSGEGIECGAQPRLRLLEQPDAVGLLQDARLEPCLCRGELHAQW